MLNQLLEACPRAAEVVAELAARLPRQALLVVVYSNAASLPGRVLRHNWRRFFHWKAVYFNSENLRSMLERAGLRFVAQSGLNTSYTVTRALDLVLPGTPGGQPRAARWALAPHACACRQGPTCRSSSAPTSRRSSERLTVIVPVFNEAAYLRAVLDELLAKQFVIPHEVIVVESNSTDGTREIVQTLRRAPRAPDHLRGPAARQRRRRSSRPGGGDGDDRAHPGRRLRVRPRRLRRAAGADRPAAHQLRARLAIARARRLEGPPLRALAREGVPHERRPAALRADVQRPLPAAGNRREHDVQGLPPRVHRRRRVRSPRLQLRHRAGVHARQERLQPDGSPGQLRRARLRRGQEDRTSCASSSRRS